MGDMGSTFLGTIYISSVLDAPSIEDSLSLMLIATPIFADAFLCVLRRYIAGHNVFDSHKSHLYQRLNQAGMSHSKVTILYILGTLFLSLVYLSLGFIALFMSAIFVIIIGFWLDKNVAKVFH